MTFSGMTMHFSGDQTSPPARESMNITGPTTRPLQLRVKAYSAPGETLTGSEFEQLFGGKGANQAVAAALLGSSVRMVSKLGADSLGEVRASLTRLEVSLALLSC